MDNAIIHVYSKEQAIEDGVLFHAGEYHQKDVVITTHLLKKLTKEELLMALLYGLSLVDGFNGPDLAIFSVNEKTVWVDDSEVDITLMFPEDY